MPIKPNHETHNRSIAAAFDEVKGLTEAGWSAENATGLSDRDADREWGQLTHGLTGLWKEVRDKQKRSRSESVVEGLWKEATFGWSQMN